MSPLTGLKYSSGLGTTNMSLLTGHVERGKLPDDLLDMSKNIRLRPTKRDYAGRVNTLAHFGRL
jgi:hypothetical protein